LTKKSLIESEDVFKELFNNMSSGVVVYESVKGGKNFVIKDINKAGEQISQVKREEVLGKLVTVIFPDVKDLGLFAVFQRVLKTGISENLPVSQYIDDRRSHWVENYVYKLPSGYIVALYDNVTERKNAEEKLAKSEKELRKLNQELELRVTERTKELEESEKKFQFLFENAPLGYQSLDYNGNVLAVNKAWLDFFGYPKDEVIGKRFGDFIDPEYLKVLYTKFPKFKEDGEVKGVEYKIIKKNGTRAMVSFNGKISYDENMNFKQTHCIFQDITEQKKAEQTLKESEKKYRKSFNLINLYKNIFAHDINNILQNIYSSVELSSLYINNPEKLHTIKELYNIINEQVNRGKKLINNVSKITEIDETETILEKSEVHLILNKAVEYLKNSFQTRNIKVQINSPIKKLYVLVNKLLLDVFENILINAVRHNNNPNIDITIDIKRIEVDGKKSIKLEFMDNGIGISAFRKKGIFQKGTRKNQKSKGMGLGLSLVKKIIDSYHGKIWVEDRIKSDYKQGSNFILLIPEAP